MEAHLTLPATLVNVNWLSAILPELSMRVVDTVWAVSAAVV